MDNNLFPEFEEQTEAAHYETIDDQPSEKESADNYEFATGDLGSFMHSFEEEKEQMGIDQMPTPEELDEIGKPTIPTKTARKTGKFVTGMIDYSLATGLSLISGQSVKEHQADADSKKELEDIVTTYIKETGGEIPIFLQLIICLLVTYGLQIPSAIMIRKQRKNDAKSR